MCIKVWGFFVSLIVTNNKSAIHHLKLSYFYWNQVLKEVALYLIIY